MKEIKRRGKNFMIPIIVIGFVLVVAALAFQQPAVSAGSPPPDVPDFAGELVTMVLDDSIELLNEPVEVNVPKQAWQVIFDADFEGPNWDAEWTNLSIGGGPYKYGPEIVANPLDPTSQKVVWSVGNGTPELDPNINGYPPNVDARLITGPFNLTDAIDAQLSFEYSLDADTGDAFGTFVSTDGTVFTGLQINNGGNGSWTSSGQNMTNYAGEPQVWFAFQFTSDAIPNTANKKGAFLDNVELRVKYTHKTNLPIVVGVELATPTPSPTPSPTPPPGGGDFDQGFSGKIEPWAPRIWTLGTSYNLSHDAGCDGDRCGFLNLLVQEPEHYVIVSPLVQSRPYPYNIETVAKVRSERKDQDQYGIIFGANYNGGDCPATDFSTCFTQYYELRVRYRDENDKKWTEYKLKRVDGVDENNQNFGPDLIDWQKVESNEDSYVEWDVNVSESGTIRIAANNVGVGETKDQTYLNNRYFGLIVRNGPNSDAEVKFDYVKIDWPTSYYQLYP